MKDGPVTRECLQRIQRPLVARLKAFLGARPKRPLVPAAFAGT